MKGTIIIFNHCLSRFCSLSRK